MPYNEASYENAVIELFRVMKLFVAMIQNTT